MPIIYICNSIRECLCLYALFLGHSWRIIYFYRSYTQIEVGVSFVDHDFPIQTEEELKFNF